MSARDMHWPTTELLDSARLSLEPLALDHAAPMLEVLSDATMYEFIGGEPPTFDRLTARYRAQIDGPADGSQGWFNWIVRRRDTGALIGFVQATLTNAEGVVAHLAWVINPEHQGLGFASDATTAMVTWLRRHDVSRFAASIHPQHTASMVVARRQGLVPSEELDDGEVQWRSGTPHNDAPHVRAKHR